MLKKVKSFIGTTIIVSLLALVFDIAVLSSIAEAKRYGGSRGGFSRSKSYSKPKTYKSSKTTVSKGKPPIKKTTVTTTKTVKTVKTPPKTVKKVVNPTPAVKKVAPKPVVTNKVTKTTTTRSSNTTNNNNSSQSVSPPSRMSGIMDSVVGTVAGFWIYNAIFGDDTPSTQQPLEPTEEVPDGQVN